MGVKRRLAAVYWRFSRWTYVDQGFPLERSGIMVAAPHTSNWDFVLMLGVAWRRGMTLKYLGKKELFRGPMGPFMRALGGIAVDRQNPAGLVDSLIARSAAGEQFHLAITPEGTRGRVDGWKSGFYRIARETGLPVTLCFVDRTTMTTGIGPTFQLTGDVAADMEQIREFFAGKTGVRPQLGAEPRLPQES